MGRMIAVAGKGGVGKSTFACLAVRYFLGAGGGPVLAVDADPNSNIPAMLGLKHELTIGSVLEEFMSAKLTIPAGMTKQNWLEMRLNQAIVESKGLDLVAMGRPEGQGCYCSPNAVLRDFLDRLRGNYKLVVADNEAGMEHLSRRTAGRIDSLVMVSDPTMKGLRTVQNLLELTAGLKLEPTNKFLVINRAQNLDPKLQKIIDSLDLEFLGLIPEDKNILEYDLSEKSLLGLPENSPAVKFSTPILEKLANKV
jgi:CO dehydrogenase maturation factor